MKVIEKSMKAIRDLATTFLALAAVSASADPTVTLDSLAYDSASRRLTILYTLTGGPAPVTLDVMTNGVVMPVASGAFTYPTAKDLTYLPFNRKIEDGTYKVYLQADKEAPGFCAETLSVRLSAWSGEMVPLYMGIDLTTKSNVVYYAARESIEGGEQAERWKTTWMLFRRISAKGTAWLYSSGRPKWVSPTLGRIHYVSFTNDFYAAVYEMTQAQWKNNYEFGGVAGITTKAEQSTFRGYEDSPLRPAETMMMAELRGLPADGIDWPTTGHAVRPATKSILGVMRVLTGVDVDLPTEAQWEYASRCGTGTPYWFGSSWDDRYGWVSSQASGETHPVGTTEANPWGLYDMYGNVYEFCLDWTAQETASGTIYDYPENDDVEPQGYASGTKRIIRGGAYNGEGGIATAYTRGWVSDARSDNNLGCRLFAPAVIK